MQLLKIKDVISLTTISKSQIFALRNKGLFPQSISLGANSIAWYEQEVKEYTELLGKGVSQKDAAKQVSAWREVQA
ncbi:hypothetical protein JCM19241_5987 [Vibrio ishigakensis]|uniref:Uncharacterized protein n=1 Tax=Vibrio ishigakensis TaxID=1481914 RepID=A0A0B8QER0_9VIBR|nr:hypothetical protein JCM19241_5987 [Vibrio ishigakensis]